MDGSKGDTEEKRI